MRFVPHGPDLFFSWVALLDVATGERKVFDASSGVPIARQTSSGGRAISMLS